MADTKIIFTSVPPDREVIVVPRGYATCHKIPAGYHHGVWTNQYKVCEYSRNRGIWISGHWQCANLRPDKGLCLRWDWTPSHWEGSSRVVIYNPPMPPRPHAHAAVAYGHPSVIQAPPVPVVVQPPPQPMMQVSYNN